MVAGSGDSVGRATGRSVGERVTVGGGALVGRTGVGDGVADGGGDGVDVTAVRTVVAVLGCCTVTVVGEVRHAENSNSDPKSSKIKIWL